MSEEIYKLRPMWSGWLFGTEDADDTEDADEVKKRDARTGPPTLGKRVRVSWSRPRPWDESEKVFGKIVRIEMGGHPPGYPDQFDVKTETHGVVYCRRSELKKAGQP